VESSQRLGRHRWKVERSLACLLANRLHLACALICARKLQPL
jgi:hypothetical protein